MNKTTKKQKTHLFYALLKKTPIAMRITLLLLFVLTFQLQAEHIYSQDAKISLNLRHSTIEQVLQTIEEKSDYYFLYNNRLINVDRKVSVRVRNAAISAVLDKLFKSENVNYEVKGTQIILSPKGIYSQINTVTEVIQQQKKTITGTVIDVTGVPIIGANIVEIGTTNGTITDVDGKFSLSVDNNATIHVSYIGYLEQDISTVGLTSFNITVLEDTKALDEVVVVGYGTMKKSDLTGSVVRAKIDKFQEAPNTNIMQSLSGTVPGLDIGKTALAGAEPTLQIRGQNTLGGSTSPLIVLDGMIYRGNIGDINPSDVESVDILKDASSKAVYGAQAANGVILISTKSGKQQKPSFNIATYYSHQTPSNTLRPLNREEYLQAGKDYSWKKAYLPPDYINENPEFVLTDNVAWLENVTDGYNKGIYYDWLGNCTSPGFISNTDLSVTGGGKDFSYMMSFNYSNQKGWVMNDSFNRKSGRINLKYDINKWLTIGTNTFLSFSDYSGDTPDFSTIAFMPPIVTPYVGNELSGQLEPYPNGFSSLNPFMYSSTDEKNIRNQLMTKAYAIITLPKIKGLTYTANLSYDYKWNPHLYSNEYMAGLTGRAYGSYSNNTGYIFDNILGYIGQFGDHGINATLLFGIEERKGYSFLANGTNFANMILSYYALDTAGIQTISSGGHEEKYLYQMTRASYNYKNKYLLTGTIRKDGFSGFAENKKIGYFPSAGIAWVISEEDFWNNRGFLNYLKLRGSYGVNGNTVSRYSSLARVSRSNEYVFNGQSALGQYITTLANKDLSWEKTTSYNFGVDFGLLNNKIMANIDYYTSQTTDLIWDLVIPQMTGFQTIKSNIGKIINNGIELTVSANNIVKTPDFNWSFDLFFDAKKNKIKSLIGLDKDGDGKEDDLIANGLFIGESINTIYDYQIDGIWQISDTGNIPSDSEPGGYKYKDINGDGEITPEEDRKILGREEPAYSIGIQNSLSFKNFSLNFLIKSIQGGKDGYMKLNEPDHRGDDVLTVRSWYADVDYWTPSNPNATYARQGGNARTYGQGTYQQRNFIRLQDISLSYNFNKINLSRIGIENLKIYMSGKDLITLTKWLGWDPETGQGVVFGGYPVMKSITFGLDIRF
ncbi:MAG: TonB-dependent receptor [Petrimonas sp.]|nr:TonB-dependent receptor [Petrimonas sp.]